MKQMTNAAPDRTLNVSQTAVPIKYISVGQPLGYLGPSASPTDQVAFWLRRGDEFLSLSGNTFRLWAQMQTPQSEKAVVESRPDLIDTISEDLAILLQEQLAVVLPADPREFLSWTSIRALPQGFGTGLSDDDPTSFEVMVGHQVLIRLSAVGYFFWAYCDGRRSIAEVIQAVGNHFEISTETVLSYLPSLLEGMLASGAIRLDAAKGSA